MHYNTFIKVDSEEFINQTKPLGVKAQRLNAGQTIQL